MVIASYIFFALFIAISIVHLIFCYFEMEKSRKISKIFCVSCLFIALVLRLPNCPLIYLGALFGVIGDYFMIKKEHLKSLILGISSFFVGHFLYALQILLIMSTPMWGIILCLISLMITQMSLISLLYPKLKYMTHKATGPGIAYFTILVVNLLLTLVMGGVTGIWQYSIIITIGYILFIFSDSFLLYTSYIKKCKRNDFYIMLTYLSAELLITLGLALMILI